MAPIVTFWRGVSDFGAVSVIIWGTCKPLVANLSVSLHLVWNTAFLHELEYTRRKIHVERKIEDGSRICRILSMSLFSGESSSHLSVMFLVILNLLRYMYNYTSCMACLLRDLSAFFGNFGYHPYTYCLLLQTVMHVIDGYLHIPYTYSLEYTHVYSMQIHMYKSWIIPQGSIRPVNMCCIV